MRAIVVHAPGSPEVLQIEEREQPEPGPDQTLIRIRAFGLNRAELFTRQGHSPSVQFPRIIGIECVGEIVEDRSGRFAAGQRVATMMGGMGRSYDGSYAQFVVVPADQVLPLRSQLSWEELGAIPEMYQTANGALRHALRVQSGGTLLIRGGTSSVGMAAIGLGRALGLHVLATTRQPERLHRLREAGAAEALIDDGALAEKLKVSGGADYLLELIGVATLDDSLQCLAEGGRLCMAGILSGSWELNRWNPMEHIPNGRYFTAYSGEGIAADELQDIIDRIEAGELQLHRDRVFRFEEIVQAHHYMESNQATGKCVVSVG